jgi:hypothetical protein
MLKWTVFWDIYLYVRLGIMLFKAFGNYIAFNFKTEMLKLYIQNNKESLLSLFIFSTFYYFRHLAFYCSTFALNFTGLPWIIVIKPKIERVKIEWYRMKINCPCNSALQCSNHCTYKLCIFYYSWQPE